MADRRSFLDKYRIFCFFPIMLLMMSEFFLKNEIPKMKSVLFAYFFWEHAFVFIFHCFGLLGSYFLGSIKWYRFQLFIYSFFAGTLGNSITDFGFDPWRSYSYQNSSNQSWTWELTIGWNYERRCWKRKNLFPVYEIKIWIF